LITHTLGNAHLSKKKSQVSQVHENATKQVFFKVWLGLLYSYQGKVGKAAPLKGYLMSKRKAWNQLRTAVKHSRAIRDFQATQLAVKSLRALQFAV
jgi:hypothetical protein